MGCEGGSQVNFFVVRGMIWTGSGGFFLESRSSIFMTAIEALFLPPDFCFSHWPHNPYRVISQLMDNWPNHQPKEKNPGGFGTNPWTHALHSFKSWNSMELLHFAQYKQMTIGQFWPFVAEIFVPRSFVDFDTSSSIWSRHVRELGS